MVKERSKKLKKLLRRTDLLPLDFREYLHLGFKCRNEAWFQFESLVAILQGFIVFTNFGKDKTSGCPEAGFSRGKLKCLIINFQGFLKPVESGEQTSSRVRASR